MTGLKMLERCQHRAVYQTIGLGNIREVRARDKNFGVTSLEVLLEALEVDRFSKKKTKSFSNLPSLEVTGKIELIKMQESRN